MVPSTPKSGARSSGEPVKESTEHRPNGDVRVWVIESGEDIDVENIDNDVEIVQEFSRTRFAQRHTEDL